MTIRDREPDSALDAFFAHLWRRNPVGATFAGLHGYDGVLPDWSESGLRSATTQMRQLIDDLVVAVPADEWEAIDIALARGHLEIRLAEDAGTHGVRCNPALWTGEAAFGIVSLMLRPFADADTRAAHLARRLKAIPNFLATAESTIGGATTPSAWKARARRECVGARLLLDDIPLWLDAESVANDLRDEIAAATPAAASAFGEFAAWFDARPDSNENASACGPELFDLLLSRGHQCTRSRGELLADARARFATEKAAFDSAARAACGSWAAVEEQLAAERPSADGLLAELERMWTECHDVAQRDDLVEWPHWPIRYVHQPEWAQRAAPHLYFLHYRSPAPFDLALTHTYLVPPVDAGDPERFLRSWNRSVLKLNHVVHHGAIGHHVQNWHAYNRAVSRVGGVAAVDCASRIAMFCGGTMAEGWACYATELLGEAGYLSPLELLSEQHSRLRFLARAIVDISLHERTMTFTEAVRFYQDEVGMAGPVAQNEATKNSMFPGTGMMYWLGLQGILDLREDMRRRMGDAFSVRRFHGDLLEHGSIPVPMVARRMMGAEP